MIGAARATFGRWPRSKRIAFAGGVGLILFAAALAAFDRASHVRAQHLQAGLARGDGAQILAWLGRTGQDPKKAAVIAKLIERFDRYDDPRIVRFAPADGFAVKWPPRLDPVGGDLVAFTAQGRQGIGFVRRLPAGRLLIARRLPPGEQGQRMVAAIWLGALGLLLIGPILARLFGWIGGRRATREEAPVYRERHRRRRGKERPETVELPARPRRRRRSR